MLTRYISLQLLTALLIIASSLTAIVWLTQALRFIDYIVNRGVSTLTFLKLTGLMLPSLLFVILPFAVFVAVLFVCYRMIGDSETIILRAAGLSRWQLGKPIMLVAGGAAIFAYFVALYLMPLTYRQFKDMQTFLRDNYASLLLQEEVFNSPVKDLTVFVRERQNDGTLKGILVHDSRNRENPITMMAQQGRLEQTQTGPRFLLYNGSRQELRNQRLSFLKFEEYAVDLSFYAATVTDRTRKPEEYYLGELIHEANKKDERQGELLAELHHRLTWPLYALILGLFAYSSMLRGEFNRRGQAKRMVANSVIAIIIVAGSLGLQNLIARQPNMVFLIYLNLAFWLSVVVFLMNEQQFISPRHKGTSLAKQVTA